MIKRDYNTFFCMSFFLKMWVGGMGAEDSVCYGINTPAVVAYAKKPLQKSIMF